MHGLSGAKVGEVVSSIAGVEALPYRDVKIISRGVLEEFGEASRAIPD